MACPKITTLNGKTAYINIGDSVPIPRESTEQNGRTTVTYDYRDVGIICVIRRRCRRTGRLRQPCIPGEYAPSGDATGAAGISASANAEADTQVRLHDGQTMVIGGLVGRSETKAMSQLPFCRLPVLGALFRHRHHEKEDTEVVIFDSPSGFWVKMPNSTER